MLGAVVALAPFVGAAGCASSRPPVPAPAPVPVQMPEAPPPAASTVPGPPEAGVLWIAAVGDLQMGSEVPADPRAGPLAAAAPWIAGADLALGNLEGPLTTLEPAKCARASRFCFAFTTPPHAAEHLAHVGLDVLSLANNHAMDAGELGRRETVSALEAAGLRAVFGFEPTSVVARGRPQEASPRRVAVLGFATAAHSPDLRDARQVETSVRSGAEEHDIVIVFFHGGAEGPDATRVPRGREVFLGEDRGDLRAFVRRAIDAGADLVLGSGPHVVRGLELYRDRLVVYSLGNFAGGGKLSTQGVRAHTGVIQVCLDAVTGRFITGRWVPFRLDGFGVPRFDAAAGSVDVVRALSIQDFWDTAPAIETDGTLLIASSPYTPFASDEGSGRCGAPPGGL